MVQHWEVDPNHEQWIGEQGSWRIVEITPDKKLFHWGFDGSDRNTFVNLFSEEDLRVAKVNGVSLGDGDDYILDLTTVTKPGECQMTKALGKDGQLIVP